MCWVAHYRGCVKAQDSARPWMQAAEVAACSCPALVRSALLCASVSGAFRPSSHWREHRCVCGTSCWAPATKLPTFKRIWSCWEELGPAGLFSIFLSRRGGKKPGGLFFYSYYYYCNEVDVPEPKVRSFALLVLLRNPAHWRKKKPPSIWISWSVTEPAQLILPVYHRCVRCGGCRSPSVSRRCCCPCHLLLRAKRGAVARWGRRTAPKDSASSMCLIRRYQVGEESRVSDAPCAQ